MTTIELKSGYYIEIDPMNYTLKQRYTGTAKNGEKYIWIMSIQEKKNRVCYLELSFVIEKIKNAVGVFRRK